MGNNKQIIAGRQIKSITKSSIVINVALFAAKFGVGLLSGSFALVADGIHSLSDMTTDAAVLLGHHFASKEPDQAQAVDSHGRQKSFSGPAYPLTRS